MHLAMVAGPVRVIYLHVVYQVSPAGMQQYALSGRTGPGCNAIFANIWESII